MKRLFLCGFAASICLSILPSIVTAGPFQTVPYEPQPRPELYIFGYGGIHWMGDFEGRNQTNTRDLEFEGQNGWGAGGGIGLRSDWLGGTRFEVEGLYRSNEVDDVYLNDESFKSDGAASITGVAVNFVKELVWGSIYPYIGFGIGYGEVDVDVDFRDALNDPVWIDDGSAAFLWQVIAGLDFPYTDRTSLFLEYRFMPISDFDLEFSTFLENFHVDDMTNHSIFAGIRYAF